MKNRSSVFRMALAAITAIAVSVGVPWRTANAQNTSTTNAIATKSPATRAAQAPALPYGVGEVVKMYRGGINKDLIVSYINNTSLPYHVGVDGIMYLQSLGIPQEITQAMIQRDGQLRRQQAMQQSVSTPPPSPNGVIATQAPGQVVTPSTPPPDITVIGSDDGYGYPYYDYGDYGPPVVVGGWGWGGGWGYGGFRRGFGGFRGGGGRFGGFHGGGGGGFHGGGGHGGGGHR